MELVWITKAKYIEDYIVELTFNDGTRKTFDFKDIINRSKTVYGPLLDKNVFRNFSLDGWTLTWLNGRIDIAPERLYQAAN